MKVEKKRFHPEGGKTIIKSVSVGAACFPKIYSGISQWCYLKKRMGIQTCSAVCRKASRPKPQLSFGFDMVLFSAFIRLLPVHSAVFDQREGLPFSDSSPSTAVVKFTSKFKWRQLCGHLNLFSPPFLVSHSKDLFCEQ